jgi:hypothetical protein
MQNVNPPYWKSKSSNTISNAFPRAIPFFQNGAFVGPPRSSTARIGKKNKRGGGDPPPLKPHVDVILLRGFFGLARSRVGSKFPGPLGYRATRLETKMPPRLLQCPFHKTKKERLDITLTEETCCGRLGFKTECESRKPKVWSQAPTPATLHVSSPLLHATRSTKRKSQFT